MKKSTIQFIIQQLIAVVAMWVTGCTFGQTAQAQTSGVWTGAGTDGLWTGDAANWFNNIIATGSGQVADFNQVDLTVSTSIHLDAPVTIGSMIFGNTDASPANNWIVDPNGNSTVNILTLAGGNSTITVTNMGTGKVIITNIIAGISGLVKDGTGVLQIDSACTFTGGTTVKNGTYILGLNSTAGETNKTDTYILGDPAGGPATLIVGESTSGFPFSNPISLATNAVGPITIGNFGNQKTTIQPPTIALNGNNLILTNGPNDVGNKFLVGSTITGTGNIICVNNGSTAQMQVSTINNNGTVTLQGTSANASAFLAFVYGANVTGINYAGPALVPAFTLPANPSGVTINSSSTVAMGAITLPSGLSNVTLNANSSGSITVGTVNSGFKGSIVNSGTGTGTTTVSPALTLTTISNVTQNSVTSPLILSGANTYTVPTLVSSGTLLWNGAFTANKPGSPITVYSGGILGGTGGIANLVTVQAGGTLAPGTNDGFTPGTLTITNSGSLVGALSLNGNLFFKLNKSLAQSNDFVTGTTLLTNLGTGTLTLANVGPAPIANGDRFQLFSHPLIGGGALTIVSTSGRFTNNLAVDGSVTAGNQAPLITNIAPVSGSISGGTLVTITGFNFVNGATVQFGVAAPVTATFINSSKITVATPAQPPGLVAVKVMNPDGQFATSGYTYVSAPAAVITGISPTNGPTAGGLVVAIAGSSFVNGDTVQFGDSTPIVATFNSSTSLTVTTPPHAAGAVNVTVADVNLQTATLTNGFTFMAPVPGVWAAANGGGDGLWTGDTANWSNNVVANGVDQTADFSQGDFYFGQTVHVDAPVTIGNAIFGTTDLGTAVQWVVDNNSSGTPGNILTLATAVGVPAITVNDPLALGNSATIAGVLAGNQGFVLTGGGMLTLGTADGTTTNTFTGGMTIANGTLFINNDANDANSADVLTLGSTNAGSSATLLLAGAGFPNPIVLPTGAQGTLTIGGDPDASAHPAITGPVINLNGNALTFIAPFGSSGNSFFKNGVTGSGNLTLTQNGSGTVLNNGSYDNSGSITMQGTGTGSFNLGNLTTNITTFNYDSSSATVIAPTINVNNNGTTINSTSSLNLPAVGGITIGNGGKNLTLNANNTGSILISGLGFQFAGNIVNSGTGTGVTMISAGIFSNSSLSNMIQNSATSPLILSGANYYTAPTLVSNGVLLVNGPVVAAQQGSPITVYSGGILGGTGGIANLVTIQAGGTLAPGTNDGFTPGTLTITNSGSLVGALSLNGNLFFKLNKSLAQSNDFVTGTTLLTNLGTGTLTLANVGPALNPGDTFQLFSHPLIGGGALTIVSTDTNTFVNNLAVDGSIQVSGGSPQSPPTIISVVKSGSNLNMVWAGGTNKNCILLTSTNIAQAVAAWTVAATNTVGADGLSTNSISINPGEPQRFYLLTMPN